jgi:hypothetical protein
MDDVRGSDPLTDEDLQRTLALFQMMMASKQGKPADPIADYLAEMQRQDEERKKQEARRSSNQSQYPSTSSQQYGGGSGRSGAQNVMGAVNTANTLSEAYNGSSLGTNLMSALSK